MPSKKSSQSDQSPRSSEIARIVDLAFTRFEQRYQECLLEAETAILKEAATAQQYLRGQLELLKSSLLNGLEAAAAKEQRVSSARHAAAIPQTETEPPKKRIRPNDAVVPTTVPPKRTRLSDIGIEEARQEIAAELTAKKERLAAERRSVKKEPVAVKSAAKEIRNKEKAVKNISKKEEPKVAVKENGSPQKRKGIEGKAQEKKRESNSESGDESDDESDDVDDEESEESEESEDDLVSEETEETDSDGYKTPPSPTPSKSRNERRYTLPARDSDPRISYPGASIRGLHAS